MSRLINGRDKFSTANTTELQLHRANIRVAFIRQGGGKCTHPLTPSPHPKHTKYFVWFAGRDHATFRGNVIIIITIWRATVFDRTKLIPRDVCVNTVAISIDIIYSRVQQLPDYVLVKCVPNYE